LLASIKGILLKINTQFAFIRRYFKPVDYYQKKIYERIARFVPEQAVKMCYQLWEEAPFRFVISNSRQTKLGDFRAKLNDELAVITVNYNLNPYSFLLTYVHEVAHQRVYAKFKNRVLPHGLEWKQEFQQLLKPFLEAKIFPEPLKQQLNKHMRNPKASSQSDIALAQALATHDKLQQEGVPLNQLNIGARFHLEEREFESIESRRTRVRCKELKSGKHYLVHKLALVQPLKD